jgi:arsenate reductase
MSDYVIYHNPNCSKSRATLALLVENKVAPEIIEYLDNPPSTTALEKILALLNLQPIELMRTNEETFTALNLGDPGTTNEQLINAMNAHPILIERPIVVRGTKAIIGRPPEQVLSLI